MVIHDEVVALFAKVVPTGATLHFPALNVVDSRRKRKCHNENNV